MKKMFYPFLLLLLIAQHPAAQVPDASFGTNGTAYTSFGPFTAHGECAALLSDGSVLAAGWNGNTTNAVLLAKYTASGLPDSTFNATGLMQFTFGSTYEEAYSLLPLSNGNVAVAGSSFGNAALAIFNVNGVFDSTFNGNGMRTLDFGAGNGSRIDKLLQQPDGKIVAVGRAYNGLNFDMMAARINLSGTLDSGFGFDGKMLLNILGNNDYALDAALQPDGKLLLAGYGNDNASLSHFCVARLNDNGTVDFSFAGTGVFDDAQSTVLNELEALQLQPDGKIVVAGRTHTDKVVLRLTENGIPDSTFSADGYQFINYNGNPARAYALALQADDKILIAGETFSDTGIIHYSLCRLLSDGSLDATFNGDGKGVYPIGPGNSWTREAMIQPDGKILLFGQASLVLGGYGNFSLLRITQPVASSLAPQAENASVVYPNPTTGWLHIRSPYAQEVLLTDSYGRCVLRQEIPLEGILDLSALPAGNYTLSPANKAQTAKVRLVRF